MVRLLNAIAPHFPTPDSRFPIPDSRLLYTYFQFQLRPKLEEQG
ncbi:hypothetical protein BJP36_36515 [Moorena producens JHB]|uniref:Uncharacterized protein n=1 Tax=Moorena producens (strain JHB) TaxID=1454205 RepID=A0A9Q9STX9_MOOP1|nr:hypothetical protein [Moorena producens]WAN69597.1 hypothetical protein BJP36_36515 [Moorena producens JHB]